jgi:hypothetical protein
MVYRTARAATTSQLLRTVGVLAKAGEGYDRSRDHSPNGVLVPCMLLHSYRLQTNCCRSCFGFRYCTIVHPVSSPSRLTSIRTYLQVESRRIHSSPIQYDCSAYRFGVSNFWSVLCCVSLILETARPIQGLQHSCRTAGTTGIRITETVDCPTVSMEKRSSFPLIGLNTSRRQLSLNRGQGHPAS